MSLCVVVVIFNMLKIPNNDRDDNKTTTMVMMAMITRWRHKEKWQPAGTDERQTIDNDHEDNVVVIIAAGGRWREAKRGKYVAQMMEMTMTETTTMEKMITKNSIQNLLSAYPRAEKAPEPILHASW